MGSNQPGGIPIITPKNPRKPTKPANAQVITIRNPRKPNPLKKVHFSPPPSSTGANIMGGMEEKTAGPLSCLKKDKKSINMSSSPEMHPPPFSLPAEASLFFNSFQFQQPWNVWTPEGSRYQGVDAFSRQIAHTIFPSSLSHHRTAHAPLNPIDPPTPPADPPTPPADPSKNELLERFRNLSTEEQEDFLQGIHLGCAGAKSEAPITPDPPAAAAAEARSAYPQECILCGDLKAHINPSSDVMVCVNCESQHIQAERVQDPDRYLLWRRK